MKNENHDVSQNRTHALAVVALVKKDLSIFFRNRRAVTVLFVAPILIAAFFGSLFSTDGARKPSKINIALVDLDNSKLSTRIAASLSRDDTLSVQALTETDAIELIRKGKVRAAITLPNGMEAQLADAVFNSKVSKPSITVHHDPSQAMVMPLVNGLLNQHVMRSIASLVMNEPSYVARARLETLGASESVLPYRENLIALLDQAEKIQTRARADTKPKDQSADAGWLAPPYTTRAEAVTTGLLGRAYNSYAQSFAGMSVQFTLFMGIDFGIALLLARRSGMWRRLRAAPISRAVVLGSSMISTTLISICAMSFVYAVSMLLFGVRIDGSVLGFVGIILCSSLFTASFGLLLASIGGNPEATRGLAILATLLLLMAGGAWVPSFVFPAWLQTLTVFLPTHWAIEGLAGVTWRGLGMSTALPAMGVLLGFTLALSLIAWWRFTWDE